MTASFKPKGVTRCREPGVVMRQIVIGLTCTVAYFTALVSMCGAAEANSQGAWSADSIVWRQPMMPGGKYGLPPNPALDIDRAIYAVSGSAVVMAFDLSGVERWTYDVQGDVFGGVAVDQGGTVYVPGKALYAFDPNGKLRWRSETSAEPVSAVAISSSGDVFFIQDGHLCAVDRQGGRIWQQKTHGNFRVGPVIRSDGAIYAVGRKPNHADIAVIFAFAPDGKRKWMSDLPAGVAPFSPAVGAHNELYFGGSHKDLYALDSSGRTKFIFNTQKPISCTPAVGKDGTIYVGSLDGYLYAVADDGRLKWSFATGGTVVSSPAVDDRENVYFTSRDRFLYCVNSEGKLIKKFAGEARSGSPILGPDGIIYLAEIDALYAIRGGSAPAASSWPMNRHDIQGTARSQ